MANFLRRLSLMPTGLRYKLIIVFCLMSIIPLMVCMYIASNFVLPNLTSVGSFFDLVSVIAVMAVSIFIAVAGFLLAKQIVEPIIDIALEAKIIASGDYEHRIEVSREDEIGDLSASLNTMTQKIRENIDELKAYGERTREINIDIQKKVTVLAGLLQIGNLISSGSDLKTVMDLLVERVSLIDGTNSAAIMMVDKEKDTLIPITSVNFEFCEALKMPASLQHGMFARLRAELKEIIIDRRLSRPDKDTQAFKKLYGIENAVILPVALRGKIEGAILVGNNIDDFEYRNDIIELLHVFCKQAAIAVENDMLIKKAEELEIRDELTGLYNNKYIRERLDEEIKRAILYQRPCSFILFNIDNFRDLCEKQSRLAGDVVLRKIGRLITEELTPVDKGARFGDDEFAIILPERNKKETLQIADEIRKKIASLVMIPSAPQQYMSVTVSGGIAENPIDGVSAKELIDRARALVKEAKASGKNMIKA